VIVDRKRLDRLFTEAVRGCDVVTRKDLRYALGFQDHAKKTAGCRYPMDRILLKFGYLEEIQIHALYKAIRYFRWRKEDKFFLKIAIQSELMTQKRADSCLQEQKEFYKDRDGLMRVNEIARRRCYLTEKQERAVIDAMKKCKGTTIKMTEISLDQAETAPKLGPRKRAKSQKAVAKDSPEKSNAAAKKTKKRRTKIDPFANPDDDKKLFDAADSDEQLAPLGSASDFKAFESDEQESGFTPLDSDEDDHFAPLDSDEDDHFAPLDSDEDDHFAPLDSDEDNSFDPLESSDDIFNPNKAEQNFDAFKTEDELDSLLPLHENDNVDNLASKRKRAQKKKAASKNRKRGPKKNKKQGKKKRRDPIAEVESKNMKVLSDDELDALWDEADLDDIDLDSDNRNVAPSPLLDSDDELDYSSSDDLF
jgi:hypothetical protein